MSTRTELYAVDTKLEVSFRRKERMLEQLTFSGWFLYWYAISSNRALQKGVSTGDI